MISFVIHLLVLGRLGASCMALIFSDIGWSPSAEMVCPKYSTKGNMKAHLLFFSWMPASSRQLNTSSRF